MNPLINLTKVNDDELMSRLMRAKGYYNTQVYYGHNSAAQSIKAVIDMLEAERNERMFKSTMSKIAEDNTPIEIGKLDD